MEGFLTLKSSFSFIRVWVILDGQQLSCYDQLDRETQLPKKLRSNFIIRDAIITKFQDAMIQNGIKLKTARGKATFVCPDQTVCNNWFTALNKANVLHLEQSQKEELPKKFAELLGIENVESLSKAVITRAYKRASLKEHPDKGGNADKFHEIHEAYQYLLNRQNVIDEVENTHCVMYDAIIEKIKGIGMGIGVMEDKMRNCIIVTGVSENTKFVGISEESLGTILPGDILIGIDNDDCNQWPISRLKARLDNTRCPVGSQVLLIFERRIPKDEYEEYLVKEAAFQEKLKNEKEVLKEDEDDTEEEKSDTGNTNTGNTNTNTGNTNTTTSGVEEDTPAASSTAPSSASSAPDTGPVRKHPPRRERKPFPDIEEDEVEERGGEGGAGPTIPSSSSSANTNTKTTTPTATHPTSSASSTSGTGPSDYDPNHQFPSLRPSPSYKAPVPVPSLPVPSLPVPSLPVPSLPVPSLPLPSLPSTSYQYAVPTTSAAQPAQQVQQQHRHLLYCLEKELYAVYDFFVRAMEETSGYAYATPAFDNEKWIRVLMHEVEKSRLREQRLQQTNEDLNMHLSILSDHYHETLCDYQGKLIQLQTLQDDHSALHSQHTALTSAMDVLQPVNGYNALNQEYWISLHNKLQAQDLMVLQYQSTIEQYRQLLHEKEEALNEVQQQLLQYATTGTVQQPSQLSNSNPHMTNRLHTLAMATPSETGNNSLPTMSGRKSSPQKGTRSPKSPLANPISRAKSPKKKSLDAYEGVYEEKMQQAQRVEEFLRTLTKRVL